MSARTKSASAPSSSPKNSTSSTRTKSKKTDGQPLPPSGARGGSAGQALVIKGARQHNLKDLDLTIPKKQLVVVTGPSGSGKSSLVFDTIYAEGQRRYVESLSAYARQFLERMDKP
ncbi:MAG: excinuclease ABC subunit A, partial [Bacteroidota bacterium]